MELESGARVNDRLRLVRPLGHGGMGAVWVAHHETLDIEVAVKFILPDATTGTLSDASVARFRREAQLAAKLDSPHVVRMLDHGVVERGGKTPYIVMELLRGESVAERLDREKRLAPADVARIVSDVAEGLASAHEIGVVHRDIKPQNLFLVRPKDVVKILDFGIARAEAAAEPGDPPDGSAAPRGDGATATGAIVGTPHYMSPEQLLESRSPDKSADLWALAVVAYELLTGKRPFSGETPAKTMMLITQAKFDRASRAASLPSEVDAFFERAFAPERARRFATAAALADALRAALTTARPAGGPSSGDADRTLRSSAPDPVRPESALATGEFVRGAGIDVEPEVPIVTAPAAREPTTEVTAVVASARPASARWLLVVGAVVAAAAAVVLILVARSAPPAPPPQVAVRASVVAADPAASEPAPPAPVAAPSASASVAAPIYLPCEPTVATRCAAEARAWCTLDGQPLGCCAPGLAAVGKDRCACPKGGTDKKPLQESGCAPPTQDTKTNAQSHVREHFGALRACYEAALKRNPKMRGNLALHVELDPNGVVGRVSFANAGAPDPDFQDCALEVMRSIQFDPPMNGTAEFTYPLSFSPG